MSSSSNIAIYAIIGIIIGAAAGYFAAGPITYSPKIQQLEDQIERLQNQQPLELSGSISIAGSTTVLPISQEAANRFMQMHPKVTISVSGGGSGAGVKSAGSGEVDIGEASRNIKASEFLSYPDLVAFAVAKDSVAVVIHPDNPLAGQLDLTIEEVSQIFSGEIDNWSELGGEDHKIDVYTREEGSGTRETFEVNVMEGKEFAADAGVKPSNGEMRAAVASNNYGICYLSFGYLDSSVSAAKIDGSEAIIENVLNGKYPITRILWVFTKGVPDEVESAFIEYLLNSEGQAIVEDLGYIPIS